MKKQTNKHSKRPHENQTPDNLKDFMDFWKNQKAIIPDPPTVSESTIADKVAKITATFAEAAEERRNNAVRVQRIIERWGLVEIARLIGVRIATAAIWYEGRQTPNASNMSKLLALPEADEADR
jgi:hypothetical protein